MTTLLLPHLPQPHTDLCQLAHAYATCFKAWKRLGDLDRDVASREEELELARQFVQKPPRNATPDALGERMARIPALEHTITLLTAQLPEADAAYRAQHAALTALIDETNTIKAYVTGGGHAPLTASTREAARERYRALTGHTTEVIEEVAALEAQLEAGIPGQTIDQYGRRHSNRWKVEVRYHELTGRYYVPRGIRAYNATHTDHSMDYLKQYQPQPSEEGPRS